jgi:8-hydroxy-5-deazaflavin:NADPH oxidoreductase
MKELRIAVLGAGNIGGTLGRKWAAAGHKIFFGVNNPDSERAKALRAELGTKITIGSATDALAASDVVVMALPGKAMDEMITTHAAQLDGKIIIDTANRMGGGPMNSFATFQTHTPQARIFRAFNTLGWENFADPVFDGIQADLFYCGPDGDAREIVEQMITDVGLRPMRLGDVDQVGLVDSVGAIWFALVFGQGKGRHLALKVLSR